MIYENDSKISQKTKKNIIIQIGDNNLIKMIKYVIQFFDKIRLPEFFIL